GFQLVVQLGPGVVHQRHVTATFSLALIRAGTFAAATEQFALVLAAASVLLRGSAGPLSAAGIFAPFPLAFAVVKAAAEMDVRHRGSLGICRFGGRLSSPAAGERARGNAPQGGSGQLIEGPAVDFGIGHGLLLKCETSGVIV